MLLVASANIVNLMFARQVARGSELATRWTLGASRRRLITQAAVECLLLAAAGALVGVGVARGAVPAVQRIIPTLPLVDSIAIDTPVLAFAAFLGLVAGLASGVIPAWYSTKRTEAVGMRAVSALGSVQRSRVRQSLTVAQVTFSLVLLVGAALLGRSLLQLLRTDLGVTIDGVVSASLNFGMSARRPDDDEIRARVARVVERVAALPGVSASGVSTALPPNQSRFRMFIQRPNDSSSYAAAGVAVSTGYFDAVRARLVSGRLFTAADDLAHPPVMIMSVGTARRFFSDGDPVGQRMLVPVLRNGANDREAVTLVGIIEDIRYAGLAVEPEDTIYRPFAQQALLAPFLVARTTGDSRALAPVLQRTIAEADRDIVLTSVQPLAEIVTGAARPAWFRTVLLWTIASLAMIIAALGLYAAVAYSVSQRMREIGIRIALGAGTGPVLMLLLREALGLASLGIVAGLGAAVAMSRGLSGMLYGIGPMDPTAFAAATVVLLLVLVIASYVPARRAMRVDPIIALRME
jgi:putative ABC transport system permease protein